MQHKQLKAILAATWPGLKRRWPWSDDPVMLRDALYADQAATVYQTLDRRVWAHIEHLGLSYADEWPDCDDYSDIKLGRFKEEWFLEFQGRRPMAPAYGVCDGYNPDGQLHDWNIFVASSRVYVSDYGQIVGPQGYRPIKVRF